MTHATNAGLTSIPQKTPELTAPCASSSLMGGGMQALLYSLMNQILSLYNDIRSLAAKVAKDQIQTQCAATTASAAATKSAADAQSAVYMNQAVQAFVGAGLSVVQGGTNRVGDKSVMKENEETATSLQQQKSLLGMKPDPASTIRVGDASPSATPQEIAAQKTVSDAATDLKTNRGTQVGRDAANDQKAIDYMHKEGTYEKFRENLEADIKMKEEKMNSIETKIQNRRQMTGVIFNGVGEVNQGISGALQAKNNTAQGVSQAAKTNNDSVSQSAGSGSQTALESLRHYFDAITALIQSTAQAAKTNAQ